MLSHPPSHPLSLITFINLECDQNSASIFSKCKSKIIFSLCQNYPYDNDDDDEIGFGFSLVNPHPNEQGARLVRL
jgi:hypothetical protein